MKKNICLLSQSSVAAMLMSAAIFVAGCESAKTTCCLKPASSVASAGTSVPAPAATSAARTVIRIKAGSASPFTDSSGHVWAAEQGFSGGDTVERPDAEIANTKDQGIYRSEHYSMDSFSCPLPNGKYLVKLHFCETYDGIEGPGQRVFSFNVQGREFKDFDVWVKAGGALKAYVESVPVEIKDGNLKITFTNNIENPQINGIEIIPQSSLQG